MTLEPLVIIILLLFALFLLAALIIWRLIELRAMGLRDNDQNRRLEAVVSRASSSETYDQVTQGELDSALNTGLDVSSLDTNKVEKRSSRQNKQAKKRAAKAGNPLLGAVEAQKATSSKSSAFKTSSFGSSKNEDAFAQFAQEGGEALDLNSGAKVVESDHEAALLKPPKPENDIFSTSERRDDIWLFHTAEVDPVHPAEDMTKFRQPGGITGESGRDSLKDDDFSQISVASQLKATTEITAPIQPDNRLRDTFSKATSEEEKVVRMTNSSSRIAAERLLVDKEIRKTQAEAHQATNATAIAKDSAVETPVETRIKTPVETGIKTPVEMPVRKTVTPAKPSQPFQGTVPPIPKGVQQNLKQTLDEVTDNVSNASKDDWKNYKNLKNTRSLISTNSDDD